MIELYAQHALEAQLTLKEILEKAGGRVGQVHLRPRLVEPVIDEQWIPYSFTWTSTGTAPVIGNGTITGKVLRHGKVGFVSLNFAPGSSTTFGTGSFRFSLPWAGKTDQMVVLIGSGYAFDTSAGTTFAAQTPIFITASTFVLTTTAGAQWGQTVPMTWATNDYGVASFAYELL
jgi:hypothetical protein